MGRFTIGLIVVASLTLTAYFGAAPWLPLIIPIRTLQSSLHPQNEIADYPVFGKSSWELGLRTEAEVHAVSPCH